MPNILSVLLSALFLLLVGPALSQTASPAAQPQVAPPSAMDTSPVELRMSWWGGNDVHRAQLKALDLFERRHPHIRVKAEYTGWAGHLERLTTQIAGGTAPDLMQINWNWLKLFSRDGRGFYDLNRLAGTLRLDGFDRDALAMSTIQGHLNGLPLNMAARLFWFNKTTFDKAGLPVPRSWDELMAAGPVFHDRLGPDYYPLDVNFQDLTAIAYSWIVQHRNRPFIDEAAGRLALSRDDMVAIARLYTRMVANHVIPDARERAAYGNVQPQEMRPWITGRYAGTYQWTSAIGKYVDTLEPGQEVVLAPYPLLSGAASAGLLYKPAMLFAINRETRHPHEAALLLDFLMNDPEAAHILGLRRGVPESAAAVAALRQEGLLHGLAWEGRQQIAGLPRTIALTGWFEHARVRDGFQDIFEALGYGRIDAEEAGSRMYEDINAILARVIR